MSASTAVYTLRTEATEKGDSNSTHRVYRAVTWGYLVDNSGSETLTADKSEKELLRERLHRLHQAVVWAGQVWLASDPGSRFASENVAKYAEEAAGLMNDDKLSIWGNQSHHAETMDSLFARRPDEDPTQLGTGCIFFFDSDNENDLAAWSGSESMDDDIRNAICELLIKTQD